MCHVSRPGVVQTTAGRVRAVLIGADLVAAKNSMSFAGTFG